jgi:hypothetical protein
MGLIRRTVSVVVPAGIVVAAVAYGIHHHGSSDDGTLGMCTATVDGHTTVLDTDQARNASLIAAISIQRGLPAQAASIALAAAIQESKLYNVRGGDRDSLGLFQQRPSQGWGTPQQIKQPVHATNAFYAALERVPGYTTLPITQAAQQVQRSGFPDAYAVHEQSARTLASALTGFSPAAFTCHVTAPPSSTKKDPIGRRAVSLRRNLRSAFGGESVSVISGSRLQVSASSSTRGWALASYLVGHSASLALTHVTYAGRVWTAGTNNGWQHGASASSGAVIVD